MCESDRGLSHSERSLSSQLFIDVKRLLTRHVNHPLS